MRTSNRSNSRGSSGRSSRPGGKTGGRSGRPGADKGRGGKPSGGSRGAGKPYAKRDDRGEGRPSFDRKDDRGGAEKPFESRGMRKGYGEEKKSRFSSDRSERSYDRKPAGERSRDRKPFGAKREGFKKEGGSERSAGGYEKRPYNRTPKEGGERKPYERKSGGFSREGSDRRSSGDAEKRPYNRTPKEGGERKPYERKSGGFSREGSDRRSSGDFEKRPYNRTPREDGERKPFRRDEGERKPFRRDDDRKKSFDKEDAPPKRRFVKGTPEGDTKRPSSRGFDGEGKAKRVRSGEAKSLDKPFRRDDSEKKDDRSPGAIKRSQRSFTRNKAIRSGTQLPDGTSVPTGQSTGEEGFSAPRKWNRKEDHEFFGEKKKGKDPFAKKAKSEDDGSVRLNRFIANAGICSRREADDLIAAGVVSVNGNVVTEMGFKVMPGDVVKYNKETLRTEQHVYVLLNKPKDFITTTDDPEERKTVMGLVAKACRERIYPVGRLDRNTTGLLLFTNDGDLAGRLTHPSFQVHKVYQVELDQNLKHTDLEKIANGLTLEDGFIKVDEVVYAGAEKNIIGVEIHSGKNRIVRRIFESLGYVVKKLDRVVFAGLTKKDLPRGRYRFLTEMEIASLKMMTGKKAKAN